MQDEDEDPAFAEFDSAAPLANHFLDLDQDGFGEHDTRNDLQAQLFTDEHSGLQQHSFDLEEEDVTTSRRGVNGRSGIENLREEDSWESPGSRMSLAFELASASESTGRNSNLLREMGLAEEEEEAEESEEQGRFYEHTIGRSRDSTREKRSTRSDKQNEEEEENEILSRSGQIGRLEKEEVSTASTIDSSFDEAAIEATFNEITTSLQATISEIQTSLLHLHDNLHSNASHPLRSSSLYNHSPSDHTSTFVDRQPLIETLASSLVKSLYAATKTRETQVRAMSEYERLFTRTEAGWESILSELEPIEDDELLSTGPPRIDDVDSPHSTTRSSLQDERSNDDPQPSTSLALAENLNLVDISSNHEPLREIQRAGFVSEDLQQLRAFTSNILNAFASANDVVQVQSALASESGRKLRALRTQVATIRDEIVQLEESESFVLEYEGSMRVNGRRSYAEEARSIMDGMESSFELSYEKARTILQAH
ncbi:uncharacterized protein JCM6883_006137 [Sporobolomyces salmoneus]|uniref:uncharacterized protein n=1 Tax=Sporobolomyces salmoneus TaxID=183962 RepID=UPI00316E90C5